MEIVEKIDLWKLLKHRRTQGFQCKIALRKIVKKKFGIIRNNLCLGKKYDCEVRRVKFLHVALEVKYDFPDTSLFAYFIEYQKNVQFSLFLTFISPQAALSSFYDSDYDSLVQMVSYAL